MAIKRTQLSAGGEHASLNDECPYCDEDMASEGVAAHLPCDETPTTDEVIEQMESEGRWP